MKLFISFLFGLPAEIATGLVIGAGMGITRAAGTTVGPGEFPTWVPIVAIVAGTLFTFLIGFWRASRQRDRFITHGLLVAAGAVGLHLATSLGMGQPFGVAHIVADALKLVAGAAAGELARRQVASRSAATT